MKFKIVTTEYVDVDMVKERERIDRLDFTDRQKKNLHKLCDLVEEGKLGEAARFVRTWGRCEISECPEAEFISLDIQRIFDKAGRNVQMSIVKPTPEEQSIQQSIGTGNGRPAEH